MKAKKIISILFMFGLSACIWSCNNQVTELKGRQTAAELETQSSASSDDLSGLNPSARVAARLALQDTCYIRDVAKHLLIVKPFCLKARPTPDGKSWYAATIWSCSITYSEACNMMDFEPEHVTGLLREPVGNAMSFASEYLCLSWLNNPNLQASNYDSMYKDALNECYLSAEASKPQGASGY